jgi:signal peptidase I
MNLARVVEDLARGPVTFKTRGGSMTPLVNSGDVVTVTPVGDREVMRGDIVLARVGGQLYLHLVTATDKNRVQISNNHGRVNGWTPRPSVHGIMERRASK